MSSGSSSIAVVVIVATSTAIILHLSTGATNRSPPHPPHPSRNEASLEALQQVGKKLRLDPASGAAATTAPTGGTTVAAASTATGTGAGASLAAAAAAVAAAAGGDGPAGLGAAAAGKVGAKAGESMYWARGTGYGFGSSSGKVGGHGGWRGQVAVDSWDAVWCGLS